MDYLGKQKEEIEQAYDEIADRIKTLLGRFDRVASILKEKMHKYMDLITHEANMILDDEIKQYSLLHPDGGYADRLRIEGKKEARIL